jgi:transcriptional regulator with XRE-family HTH domain
VSNPSPKSAPSSPVYPDYPDACHLPLAAKEVRDARLLLGYSQTRLAQVMGVRQISTISDWEQGITRPSPAMEVKLRAALRSRMWRTPMRRSGDGTWLAGKPRRDAAAQYGRGPRIGT